MEQFCGSITNYRFALVVPAFFRDQVEQGTLTLVRGGVRRSFSFLHGELVSQSSSSPDEHLGNVLVELNLLDASRAAELFDAARAIGAPQAQYAVEQRILSEHSARAALKLKATRGFVDCYRWHSGEMSFSPAAVFADGLPLGLDVKALHSEALSQVKAARHLRPHGDNPAEIVSAIRSYLRDGDFEGAHRALEKALEVASLPEAQALYREAEEGCRSRASHALGELEGKLRVTASGGSARQLRREDFALFTRLQHASSLGEAIARCGLGTIRGYRAVKRLLDSGAIAVAEPLSREARLSVNAD